MRRKTPPKTPIELAERLVMLVGRRTAMDLCAIAKSVMDGPAPIRGTEVTPQDIERAEAALRASLGPDGKTLNPRPIVALMHEVRQENPRPIAALLHEQPEKP